MRLRQIYGSMLVLLTRLRLRFGNTGTIRIPGIKFPLVFRPKSVDIYTVEEVFIEKDYDISLPPSWGEPQYIIDGGANIGLTSVFFANKYPNALIIAIEPEESNYRYLLQNSKHYPNIRGLNSAIWKNNALIAVRDRGFGLRGFVVEEVGQQTPDAFPGISISELIRDHKAIDILKLDIEGSEKSIFEGDYEQWLPFVKCLIIELHDRMLPGCTKSVFSAIGKYNFSCSPRGDKLVCINKTPGRQG